MKSVLITTGIFPPDIGGPATYVPRFSDYLTSQNLKVEVITLSETHDVKNSSYPFNVLRIERNRRKFLRILRTVFTIMKALKNADYLFCNGLYFETALSLRLSSRRVPSLVKIVGDPVWERAQNRKESNSSNLGGIQNVYLSYFSRFEKKLVTWSLEQFDRVTTPGDNLAKEVESWSKKIQVHVIQNGVPIQTQNSKRKKQYDLVTISRLVPWKNVNIVIKIAENLNCTLAIIGDGPERKSLEAKTQKNSKVTFLGSRTSEKIVDLLHESRIFCQLSDYEGLSFSLLQAMEASLPCVLSDIKANRDVFESDQEAGIFVRKGDIQEMSSAIASLLSSPGAQQHLGSRCRKIVEQNFDEINRMREMMKLLITHD